MDRPHIDDRASDAAFHARVVCSTRASAISVTHLRAGNSVSSEFHVAGIVVYAVPAELERVAREIAALSGARVHASSAVGKLVVTLEAATTGEVLSRFDEVQRVRGVLNAALVYQHGDREVGDGAPGGHEEVANARFA
jgi:nitrate reductase NapD